MRPLLALLLLSGGIAPAVAQAPAPPITVTQFAWQWPIDTGGTDGAVRLTLTPEIYSHITRADLADLAAFNASDEGVPFGAASLAFERLVVPLPPAPVALPIFRVPVASPGVDGDRVELHIARGSDGRLSQLDAQVVPQPDASAREDLLLDASSLDRPVTGLRIEVSTLEDAGLNARLEVAASDDLATWQVIGSDLALVSLRDNGLTLERRELDIAATGKAYLRLRRTDAGSSLPVSAVLALRGSEAAVLDVLPARRSLSLQGGASPGTAGAFEYTTSGPFPIERVDLTLADRNAVAGFVLETRDAASSAWIERTRGTAFRIGAENQGIVSAPIDVALLRDRYWRVRTDPAQPRAPTLTLSYRPEQFVLLTQGNAPYRLVAGSREARRPAYPLRAVLSEFRARHGDLWLPPEAMLGTGTPLSGDVALAAPTPAPNYRQWLLWGVLIGGAVLVAAMVINLMRNAPTGEG